MCGESVLYINQISLVTLTASPNGWIADRQANVFPAVTICVSHVKNHKGARIVEQIFAGGRSQGSFIQLAHPLFTRKIFTHVKYQM